jgi:hypothetical protein
LGISRSLADHGLAFLPGNPACMRHGAARRPVHSRSPTGSIPTDGRPFLAEPSGKPLQLHSVAFERVSPSGRQPAHRAWDLANKALLYGHVAALLKPRQMALQVALRQSGLPQQKEEVSLLRLIEESHQC